MINASIKSTILKNYIKFEHTGAVNWMHMLCSKELLMVKVDI
jgi:hypothetical protein